MILPLFVSPLPKKHIEKKLTSATKNTYQYGYFVVLVVAVFVVLVVAVSVVVAVVAVFVLVVIVALLVVVFLDALPRFVVELQTLINRSI